MGPNAMRIDCTGMRCPQPVLKLAVETSETPAGTVVEDVIVRLVGEGAVVVLEDQHRSAVPAFLVRRGLPVVGHVVHRLRSASNDPCSVSAR